jgi:glutaconate CoA-transferase subunit B
MDFKGDNHAIRVISLHPGVTFAEVQDNTGFALEQADELGATPAPQAQQLAVLAQLDPHDLRKTIFRDNPPGER